MKEIGGRISCSRQRVARWMAYYNVEKRTTNQAMYLRRQKRGELRGPNWRGGRWFNRENRTWFVYVEEHPKRRHNGAVEEHILVAEKALGRHLKNDECVHHLDLNHANNARENLCVLSRADHMRVHRILGEVGIRQLMDGNTAVLSFIGAEKDRELVERVYRVGMR